MFGRLHLLDITWLALIVLAIATVLVHFFVPHVLATGVSAKIVGLSANAAVLAFAVIKGRRIALDYLDLRSAPALWSGLVSGWVVLVALFAWLASAVVTLT